MFPICVNHTRTYSVQTGLLYSVYFIRSPFLLYSSKMCDMFCHLCVSRTQTFYSKLTLSSPNNSISIPVFFRCCLSALLKTHHTPFPHLTLCLNKFLLNHRDVTIEQTSVNTLSKVEARASKRQPLAASSVKGSGSVHHRIFWPR